jgi:hypothetical protein
MSHAEFQTLCVLRALCGFLDRGETDQDWVCAVKLLTRMFHELPSRDHADGRATGQPQGVGSEAYLNGTSQGELVLSLPKEHPRTPGRTAISVVAAGDS